jgi:ribosomal protein L11 methyltransferase
VLDVGCGSGVLAIGALASGARHARAIDIAPAAIEIVTANARRNGCEAQLKVDTTALAELEGSFDVVVANILAPTLIALADDLCRVLAPNGVLVLAGVLEEQVDAVAAALRPLRVDQVTMLDGWAAVELRATRSRHTWTDDQPTTFASRNLASSDVE